ncbi:uncharacterized protein METZ01_LOCUS326921, partial [marine metagenome]
VLVRTSICWAVTAPAIGDAGEW